MVRKGAVGSGGGLAAFADVVSIRPTENSPLNVSNLFVFGLVGIPLAKANLKHSNEPHHGIEGIIASIRGGQTTHR